MHVQLAPPLLPTALAAAPHTSTSYHHCVHAQPPAAAIAAALAGYAAALAMSLVQRHPAAAASGTAVSHEQQEEVIWSGPAEHAEGVAVLGSWAHPDSHAVLSRPHSKKSAAAAGMLAELQRHAGGACSVLDPLQQLGWGGLVAAEMQKPEPNLTTVQPPQDLGRQSQALHCPMGADAVQPLELQLCLPSIACRAC